MDSLSTLVASLFIWINSHQDVVNANFQEPPNLPEIQFIEHKKLAEIACEKPCPVIGWYPTKNQKKGQEVLYLIKGVDPIKDLCTRTILLHEIIHFWQDYNKSFINEDDSQKVVFTKREQQASILEHIYRGQQYEDYRNKNGKNYEPKCCKQIAFGRCVNNPEWLDQYIKKK